MYLVEPSLHSQNHNLTIPEAHLRLKDSDSSSLINLLQGRVILVDLHLRRTGVVIVDFEEAPLHINRP